MPSRRSSRFMPNFGECIPIQRAQDLIGCDVYVEGGTRIVPYGGSAPFDGKVHVAGIQHHDAHEIWLKLKDRTFVKVTKTSLITEWVRSRKVLKSVITLHDFQDLSEREQELCAAALEEADNVHPSTPDRRGAAIGLEKGGIILGRASGYNTADEVCAERDALERVAATGKFADVRTLAVSGPTESLDDPDPMAPCGACRQRILGCQEAAGGSIVVLFSGGYGQVARIEGIEALLPLARL